MFSYARPWLGQLQRLVLWHNNSGAAAGRGPWHLEAVEVSCSKDQQVSAHGCITGVFWQSVRLLLQHASHTVMCNVL